MIQDLPPVVLWPNSSISVTDACFLLFSRESITTRQYYLMFLGDVSANGRILPHTKDMSARPGFEADYNNTDRSPGRPAWQWKAHLPIGAFFSGFTPGTFLNCLVWDEKIKNHLFTPWSPERRGNVRCFFLALVLP